MFGFARRYLLILLVISLGHLLFTYVISRWRLEMRRIGDQEDLSLKLRRSMLTAQRIRYIHCIDILHSIHHRVLPMFFSSVAHSNLLTFFSSTLLSPCGSCFYSGSSLEGRVHGRAFLKLRRWRFVMCCPSKSIVDGDILHLDSRLP